jgi:WS/DGAT/MGAT family acyltransferase
MTRDLWAGSMHALRDPVGALELAAAGADTLGELARTVTTPADTTTRFHRRLSGIKHVAWAEPMPLADIKAVSKALGCTVNDVLVSCAAGALRRYLETRGDEVDGLEFRAEVPVNLRPPEEDFTRLGNRFGLVLLDLPIGVANPFERLFEVRRRMEALKTSRQPLAAYLMLNAMGRLPEAVERPMLEFFTTKATTVMTNVPGPQEPLFFAGSELTQLMFWVPQAGLVGIGVSILSYRGAVQIGVIADDNLIPDPDTVAEAFAPEFRALADCVRTRAGA